MAAGKEGRSSTRRETHWDRPAPPRDLRWTANMVGRTLVVLGLLSILFAGYQLWGTGIEHSSAQRSLRNEFEERLADVPSVPAPTSDAAGPVPTGPSPATRPDGDGRASTPSSAADSSVPPDSSIPNTSAASTGPASTESPPTEPPSTEPESTEPVSAEPESTEPESTEPVPIDQGIPAFQLGDAIARLQIPRIGLDTIVVSGVDREDLKRGPGHYPQTPLPGQVGNSAIAGHRSTYGEPFANIDDLSSGDEIIVTTVAGTFAYAVDGSSIVGPNDGYVVTTTDPSVARLTLTTCHPRYSASQRLVVTATLIGPRSAPVGIPAYVSPPDGGTAADTNVVDTATGDTAGDTVPVDTADDAPTVSPGSSDTPASAATAPDGSTDQSSPDRTSSDQASDPTSPGAGDPAAGDPQDEGRQAVAQREPPPIADDPFAQGWFDDGDAYLDAGLWAAVLVALAIAGYLVCRRFRNDWSGPLLVTVPFVVALYFLFQNVNRMLPAAL